MAPRLATICLLVLALSPLPAHAAPPAAARAKKLFERGNVHFNLGEYKTALQLYRDAYTVKPLPGFLFNIGQCHYNLEEYDKALAAYERYLSEQPDAHNRGVVQAQIANARAALARQREEDEARQPTSQPTGGDAEGDLLATDPQRAQTKPEPQPTPQPAAPAADAPSEPPPTWKKALLGTGVALAGALLATGVVTRGIALSMASEYTKPTTPLERQLTLADRGETLTTISNVTLIAGAALGVGSGLYYWFGYRARRKAPAANVALLPLTGDERGGLLSLQGSF